jgi:pyruvate/2-oxoglutarate dehydrogenase complex dihydrolipoamide dehydrogenase (E3) component
MTPTHDAIVVGTGQAGPSLASRLSQAGMRVAVIERHLVGGTCVNTGCIPTKTMVASAYAAHLASRGGEFGFSIEGAIKVDFARVQARRAEISARSRQGLEKMLTGLEKCDFHRGHARFRAPREIVVSNTVLAADRIFLNVGGRAAVPPLAGIETTPYLTNSSMMDLAVLPEHLVVVGGSYVGLEFGQMFRRFGSKVTIVEMGAALIGREDADTSKAIYEMLADEGIGIRLNAKCISVSGSASAISAQVDCTEGEPAVHGSHLLIATGRKPNTGDLGLDLAGIKQDDHGYVIVDDELRTSAEGVWALGDCNGRGAFTHTSYNDFEIVAANLLDGQKRRVSDRIVAYALYTDPPLGRAGLTEAQVRKGGRAALMGTRAMTRVGRAVEKGETKGFMKVLVDRESRQILGASILGTGGDEAIHCVLDLMYAKAPYDVLQRAVHIHPTVSELIPTVLGELKPL